MLYEIDLDYGLQPEKAAIIELQTFFGYTLTKLSYYDNFDFYNEKESICIEIKAR